MGINSPQIDYNLVHQQDFVLFEALPIAYRLQIRLESVDLNAFRIPNKSNPVNGDFLQL